LKLSIQGALLSGLVYPGLGQIVQGSRLSGTVFAVSTTASLLVIIYRLTLRIYRAVDPVLSALENHTFSWSRFVEIVSRSSFDSWRVEGISLVFLLTIWAAASVHAYLAGRSLDRKAG